MSNIERKYAYYDEGVLPEEGAYGTTYLTLYNSDAGNVYDGWLWDPNGHIPDPGSGDEHKRTFGYRNPDYPNYAWDDEVIVDLSNPQNRDDIEDVERGRITAFNTSVSDQPIVLEDVDITALTESEREAKATTVLFTAIPLVKDSYIQAAVEVQMKVNISPTNTTGMVRVEAFYILNDESDRTMRPNPVHTFAVATENERHTLPWLYFNPALNHEESNYIGVKLLVTGGTAEIGISDNPDYGDAMITLVSAGLVGDRVFDGKPVAIHLTGEEEVMPNYILHYGDYNVTCEYDTGEVYNITHMCEFSPRMGTEITEDFTLTATYQGLSDSMEVMVLEVDHIELVGLDFFEDAYTLNPYDYTVRGYFIRTGTQETIVRDVTERATYAPAMGTTITQDSTLVATYHGVSDSLNITKLGSPTFTGTIPNKGFVYDFHRYRNNTYICRVSGTSVSDDGDELLLSKYDMYMAFRSQIQEQGLSLSILDNVVKFDIWCGGHASVVRFGHFYENHPYSLFMIEAVTDIYDHTPSDFYEKVTDISYMFYCCRNLVNPPYFGVHKHFGKIENAKGIFYCCAAIRPDYWKFTGNGFLTYLDMSECVDISYAFDTSSMSTTACLMSWNTEKVENMKRTFALVHNRQSSSSSPLGYIDEPISVSGIEFFNTESVTDFEGCFVGSNILEEDGALPQLHWNVRNAINMKLMFSGVFNRRNSRIIRLTNAGNISGWRPRSVEDISSMFSDHTCRNFGYLTPWNIPNYVEMDRTFGTSQIDPETHEEYDPIVPSWYHE